MEKIKRKGKGMRKNRRKDGERNLADRERKRGRKMG